MIFIYNPSALDAIKGMSRYFRGRYFRWIDNAFNVPVDPTRAPEIVFRDKAWWSCSMAVRAKNKPTNRKPRMLFVFRQDFLQVVFLDGKKELIVVDESNPACASAVGVEAVLEDIPLLPDAGPFA